MLFGAPELAAQPALAQGNSVCFISIAFFSVFDVFGYSVQGI